MKSLFFISLLAISQTIFAESVTCRADKTIQLGFPSIKTSAEITFDLDRSTKTINKLNGHIFVQSPYYEADEEISTENSYMGFFNAEVINANPRYRPIRYKNYTQFKNVDAAHTTGQENGMWGSLVMDLNNKAPFDARYIFQAGDHMGATVLFTCR